MKQKTVFGYNINVLLFDSERKCCDDMRKYKLEVSLFSTRGRIRSINQDNYFINGKTLANSADENDSFRLTCKEGLFAVADGMGGEHDGEFASLAVVRALADMKQRTPTYEQLCKCIENANNLICARSESISARIGSTIVAAVISGERLAVCNVGDSKCLMYKDGKITQLSKDHTVTAQLVEAGIITPEQALKDNRRHRLFQHLGIPQEEMTLSVYSNEEVVIQDGDIIILCSDGLTDGLSFDDISSAIKENNDIDNLSQKLAALAMEKGSTDNITVMTIAVTEKKRFFGLF